MQIDGLDLSRVSAMGDPSTAAGRAALRRLFEVYVASVRDACRQMRAARLPAAVAIEAHRAKGASDVIGATTVAPLLAEIEARAAAGEHVEAGSIDEVEQTLDILRQTIDTLMGEEVGL